MGEHDARPPVGAERRSMRDRRVGLQRRRAPTRCRSDQARRQCTTDKVWRRHKSGTAECDIDGLLLHHHDSDTSKTYILS
jgi:hypothetical protein